jgi:DNA polymerase III subunit beta
VVSLRTIGRMARESGLTVSALRFYDAAGVICPATVDPRSGYRYYAPEQLVVARLVASLRRVGMPLVGIREVLAHRHDSSAVDALLAAHLRRLEQGLADARRELSSVRSLIEEEPMTTTTVRVAGAELVDALRAVRFAVAPDSELPVLTGVLLEINKDEVTLVATDRYRLAVASAPVVELTGPPVSAVVPAKFVDRIPAAETVVITVTAAQIRVGAGDEVLEEMLITDPFPDYRRLLPTDDRPVPVDAALRAAVAAAPTRTMRREPDGVEYEVAVLSAGPDGIRVTDGDGIGVNREFLLEALDAGGDGQLRLSLDGPIAPLVIRSDRSVSLLMPVWL